MSDASKDIDDAAEPFMEQAREALGDVTGDEDTRNAAHPPDLTVSGMATTCRPASGLR